MCTSRTALLVSTLSRHILGLGAPKLTVSLTVLIQPRVPSPPAGTGTFGRVQLVKDKTAKHFFALKVMSIPDVIRLKQEQHVHNEKSVLKEVSHPFLVKL